jgi:coenzyme F420-0:L-glutamate ligase / coenzyme F420-1:gamma-L-glutamate ligase
MISIIPVTGMPDIQKGDNLGNLIVANLKDQRERLQQGDIAVVTQKVVSKAEGRIIALSRVNPSPFAAFIAKETGKDPRHVEVILRESKKIVKMKGGHLITETKHGFVCANSGVDASNVEKRKTNLTLLPIDPDASANRIRKTIGKLTGKSIPVIITDTFGRAWRMGHVNFAVGVSGMKPVLDYRGTRDMYGHVLNVTEMAVADEIACAAELVMNKADGIPVAIVRGYKFKAGRGSARDLLYSEAVDLFR